MPKAVRDVVRLDSHLQPLGFVDTEDSRQGRIERPCSGAANAIAANSSNCAQSRQRKRSRVQVIGQGTGGLVAVRIGQNLIRALVTGGSQTCTG